MTDKVQKIREEVVRLQNELIQEREKGNGSDVDDACILELQNVLTYIDSLQEEPVSEELEEAALLYYPKMPRISEPHGVIPADNQSHYLGDANEDNRRAFIVGAKWKEKEMQSTIELAEDHAMLAGMEKMKEQMMAKAIDVELYSDGMLTPIIKVNDKEKISDIKFGDKVKLIIIKKDKDE